MLIMYFGFYFLFGGIGVLNSGLHAGKGALPLEPHPSPDL
jgi:hypothetical protein